MNISSILADKGTNVITAGPDAPLGAVSKTLADNRIGAIVILEGGEKVCGIVSERDIVRQVAARGGAALDEPISVCMTKKVVSCDRQSTIDEVMGIMTRHKFRHIPVIEGGKLIGIVSIGDVVKHKIEQAEREAADLKQYIAG